MPNFLFAAQEASGREQTPDASEHAEDSGEAPVHPASDRVDAALGSDECVHGDVRPVRMRQLITGRLGLVGRGIGVRLDDDEEAEYEAPKRTRTTGASRHPPSHHYPRIAPGEGEVGWWCLDQQAGHQWARAGRRDLGQDRCRAIRSVLGQEQFLEGGFAAE